MDNPNKILVGHDLAKNGGMTFLCTKYGTAREFDNIEDAQDYILALLDPRIWKPYVCMQWNFSRYGNPTPTKPVAGL